MRDDRPFGGGDPPAAVFHFSPDRRGEHPQAHLANWTGVLQADAYGGYGRLYGGERKPAPIIEAACWAHARRKFFELADIEGAARQRAQKKVAVIAPLALEAVRRMDELFAIEREANGRSASERLAVRSLRSAPIVAALEDWMRAERVRLPGAAPVAKAMNYMLDRWPSFAHLLDDGRVCMTNNAAERALRGLALGRKAWLFAGSNRGGQRAAFFNSLIVTAKLNDVDPQAWLADVLGRIASHPAQRLAELLPWNWQPIPAASPSFDAAA
ncbi:IS66 family transposase [Lichenibacterium minor]|uniref:IS66 family transposase n=1 Tax=Lichenibacterium minor TaxID=2316528 RepID=A0A4Q2U1N7_9HYPH|nr:IS66 family transposase [Lichenibacterium minor]